MTTLARPPLTAREMLNKVPEVTVYFWIIKIMSTTVGETAADYLQRQPRPRPDRHHVHHGRPAAGRPRCAVPGARYMPGDLLAGGRADQRRRHPDHGQPDRQPRRRAGDDHGGLRDRARRRLRAPGTPANGPCRSTPSPRPAARRSTGWPILFTFALGTAAGDLVAERLSLGYSSRRCCSARSSRSLTVAHFRFGLNAVVAFWVAYILTRPLGASIGDFLSQPRADGGLGLGTDSDELDLPRCHSRRGHLSHRDAPGRDRAPASREPAASRRCRAPRAPARNDAAAACGVDILNQPARGARAAC